MFIWLLEGLELYKKEGLEMTEDMKKHTNAYKNNQDVYFNYMEECCEKKEGGKIFLDELYVRFKEWFINSNPGKTIPPKRVFVRNLNKICDFKLIQKGGIRKKGVINNAFK